MPYSRSLYKMALENQFFHVPLNFEIFHDGLGGSGGCFINVSQALQNNLAKVIHAGNHIYGENFQLKLCMCAQSVALGTRTKFQLEILTRSTISAIHKFLENVLESSRNISETTPWVWWMKLPRSAWNLFGWYRVPWIRSLFKMVILGQILHVPQDPEIFHDRLEPGLGDYKLPF